MSDDQRNPCPLCGEMIMATALKCRFCGEEFSQEGRDLDRGSEGDATGGIIPYKNVPALIGYYCGVFSVIPCFPIGLVGFVLGIIGLRNAIKNPQVKGKVHAWIGIVAGGLFGFGWLALTLLVVLAGMRQR